MTLAGIPIRLHLTFLLVLSALFLLGGAGPGVLFFAALFGCVLLHELGHALMAQRFGIGVREIVLYPIGGVARLVGTPTPKQELWVTAAGPAVNVALAAGLFAYLAVTGQAGALTTPGAANFAERLLFANVACSPLTCCRRFPWMAGGCCGLGLRSRSARSAPRALQPRRAASSPLGWVCSACFPAT
jgi:Zn-dependent protease